MNNRFPQFQDLQDEWQWGFFNGDATQLNIYVEYEYITPEQFQAITGQAYSAN